MWLNEGIAELFQTAQLERDFLRIGATNRDWIEYHRRAPKHFKVTFERLFAMGYNDEYYTDARKSTYFYATSWLFAHYCWFGRPELKDAYLALAVTPGFTEDFFKEKFGFGYEELERALVAYAERSRYRPLEISLKKLGPLPEADIRIAEAPVWKAFHARAHLAVRNLEQARELSITVPQNHPYRLMAVETLVGLSGMSDRDEDAQRYLDEAERLGTQNSLLLTQIVERRLAKSVVERSDEVPILTAEVAGKLLTDLRPSLRLHRKNPWAVSIAIRIFDLSAARVPPPVMEMFALWESEYGGEDRETTESLRRIRERQGLETTAGVR